ncbi:2-dehydropantoate 2-reductase [Jeotgalicoccus coquinae]|uniref:6-phosphogluconate dehydrogenase, decarboxylating n=1 Tax=Jeotgalicoccus coquinae TaxID=709509 RepID=A0A6V7RAB3_9STAP|nr:ketopantoate reductase C-terminal domain-containing protein [Jeotgalicoccus coquinae]MBB6422719.1 2-dehydropantoate 2-reductase [Jeotgalicoccus coquinae]GGE13693.1 2-dehydropantoate 2-reductase [Jeotgalicoccus coquinae]CAD2074515.1 2-dehydropantoate 2-reductase [Jeotgalicoccus coquinae]
MKIGIIGAGAVGSIIAREFSLLPEDKVQLTLMARTERGGFTILENGVKTYHEIKVHEVKKVTEQFDVLFIASKTPALNELQHKIQQLTHEDSEIIYALNGMGYDDVFARGIPGVVYISGQQHDGYIEHFVNQKIILPQKNYRYIDKLIGLIESSNAVNFDLQKSAQFNKIRYEKLLINVGINSMTALSKNTSKIFEDEQMVQLTRRLLQEAITVVNQCNRHGITVESGFTDYAMDMYFSYPREMGTSMYYDVMANRSTEFKYIQQFIHDMKDGYDIRTPVLDVVVTLLQAYEKQ